MKFLLSAALICLFINSTRAQKIAGTIQLNPGIEEGLILFAPLNSKNTYLVDNCGRVVNTWQSEYNPGNTVYLLPNGNLFRTNRLTNTIITGGGGGGGVEILDWDSKKIWSFTYNSEVIRQHHDAVVLPNGNVLMIVWEVKSKDESLSQGRSPDLLADDVIWSERIVEIKPVLPDGGELVWQWSVWDHLIQDFDPGKLNYGVVSDHPELVDLNFSFSDDGINDWIHANAIDYNADLDQIVLSSPFLNEFWIIDHSTSTEEAASHAGGLSGKGGDLLFRWGNPVTYKKGSSADQKLFGQHHVHWINKNYPHGGEIMVFNNQHGPNYSTVDIIKPTKNEVGEYVLEGGMFGPGDPSFIYTAEPPESLSSMIMSGAEMLPNGNLLICSSLQGKMIEVTPDKEIVWEYRSPITTNGIVGRDLPADQPFISDRIFRSIKYSLDHPGFTGKNLTPGEPIEGEPWLPCALVTSTTKDPERELLVYPNPVKEELKIKFSNSTQLLSAKLLTVQGYPIGTVTGFGEVSMDVSAIPNGVYIVIVNNTSYKIIKIN